MLWKVSIDCGKILSKTKVIKVDRKAFINLAINIGLKFILYPTKKDDTWQKTESPPKAVIKLKPKIVACEKGASKRKIPLVTSIKP